MLHGPVDAAEDHVNLILLDELSRLGFPNAIGRCTVLEVQIELPPQQATLCIDVVYHHLGHVRTSEQGTHAQLMAIPRGIYQRLVQLVQLVEDEDAADESGNAAR